MPTSPVLKFQREARAELGKARGWDLPSTYSSLAEDYWAATQKAGLVDRSYTGRLRLTGRDSLDLLNRLSTNKLEDLAVGEGMYTVLTSSKGRILDLLFVLRLDDHLLVLTSFQNRQKVADWIDFYTFAEDAAVQDITEETAMLAVMGPGAASLLDELTQQEVSSLARYECTSTSIRGIEVMVIRTDFAGLPGYDLAMTAPQAQQLWSRLLSRDNGLEIALVGMKALEVVRIEQGIPVYGKELSEEHNPLEANLWEFISFNKGCYVGQEVVARLNTYDKVQKRLVGLSWTDEGNPTPNADLYLEGKRVGSLTSATRSPRLKRGIGLGYVKKAHAQPGARLSMEAAEDDIVARVEELPFKL